MFQYRTQHIGGHRVLPAFARRVTQGHAGDALQILGKADLGLAQTIGNPGGAVGTSGTFQESIAQARGVVKQLADGDHRCGAIRQLGIEVRKPAADRIVQAQATLFHQVHRGGGDQRFGHRCQAKDRVLCHRAPGFAVRQAGSTVIHQLPVPQHQHHGAHQALVGNGAVDHRIHPLGEQRVRAVGAGEGGAEGGGKGHEVAGRRLHGSGRSLAVHDCQI